MNGTKWALIGLAVLALLSGLAMGAAIYGSRRWEQGTQVILARLEAARTVPLPARYDARELDGLPVPVQRYFRAALTDGQAIVSAVSIRHACTFNMSATAE